MLRSAITAGLVVLAILSFIPIAVGDDTCVPSCEVPSHTFAYVPPLTFVASGSSVTWSTLDIVHTATDRHGCFHVDFNIGQPASARFFIADGALFAEADGETNPCPAATNVGGSVFVQEYECLLHPGMRASLVVG